MLDQALGGVGSEPAQKPALAQGKKQKEALAELDRELWCTQEIATQTDDVFIVGEDISKSDKARSFEDEKVSERENPRQRVLYYAA